jgi:HPt (histidine-containing phosphotransfer) domain-containing protein
MDQDQAPVDLAHLRQFTGDDRDVEAEILGLFVDNAALYLDQIRRAARADDWLVPAHSLKGSARGVGARGVERAAERLEQAARAGLDRADLELGELEDALALATAFVRRHLG